jgi:hypothetical protein
MTDQNKLFMERSRDVAKGLLPECKGCGGEGDYDDAPDGSCSEHFVPCPTCAELRAIAEWKQAKTCTLIFECDCGATELDPCSEYTPADFDIPTIRHTMEVLLLWKGFVKRLFSMRRQREVDRLDLINTATDAELLIQETNEYMRGRKHEKGNR